MGLLKAKRKKLSNATIITRYRTMWLHCGHKKVEVDLSKPLSEDTLCLRCKRRVSSSVGEAHIPLCMRCRRATIYKVTERFEHGSI
jgi:hypothetical protein